MAVLKFIWETLKLFDYFGANINLRVQKEEKFTTPIGGLGSIVFTIGAFYFCLLSFISLITRGNMNLIFYEKYYQDPPKINFTEQNFNLAFSLYYDTNNSIISNLSNLYLVEKINLVKMTNSSKKEKFPLKLRNCIEEDFYGILDSEKFKILGFNQKKCINNFQNVSVQGAYSSEVYQYIEYGISIDQNLFKGIDPKSQKFKDRKIFFSREPSTPNYFIFFLIF